MLDATQDPGAAQTQKRTPFERIALLLQGGGALGAYQAGVYQALAEADLHPDWVAGISIGAINSALIAGNPPEKRVERLREFWETVSKSPLGIPYFRAIEIPDENTRRFVNQARAMNILFFGAPHFFAPRLPPAALWGPAATETVSYYDNSPLLDTLNRLVDFDRINAKLMRFSVGAVNVRTGNFAYFDTETHHIVPKHIMASGSLPPGFPATEIDGEYLLGRRARLQHAAAMGARQPAAPGHHRLPGRSLERARRLAARHGVGGSAPQGDRLFEPHPRRDRPVQDHAEAAHRARQRHQAAAGGTADRSRRAVAGGRDRREGLQHRPPDLPRAELRGRLQGFRVLPPDHGRALAEPATTTRSAASSIPRSCSCPTGWKASAPSTCAGKSGTGNNAASAAERNRKASHEGS